MSGSSTQYNAQGEYVAQGNAQQYNTAGGTVSIGPIVDETAACLAAVLLTDPRDDREQLIQAKGSRVVGTCEWIKSIPLYDSWLHSHSQLLWLSGGPGKGKTMLSIFLAEELERTAKHSQYILFLQYFCDNKDEKRKTATTIIRGLIFQLLQSRKKLFDHILPSFKIQKESLFAGSSFETLWRIFESMIRDPILGTTYCVLDGLDECDEASLEVLLGKFAALFSAKFNESSVCHLNLIVVSRDLPDFIPELLSSFPRIRLDPDADTKISKDINTFIEVKVKKLSVDKRYPEPLRVHVEEVFQNRAQGTFLWVEIVAKELRKFKAIEVEKALDLFPPGLDELYARILLQIDVNRREIAAKILRWVVMAVRPLTLSELSIAIDTTARPSLGFSRDEVMKAQATYCGYFLTIKEDKVGLIHQSAKDYLLRKTRDSNPELENFRVKEEAVNLEIARKCLHYLQDGALAAGKVDLRKDTSHLRDFPLLSYAALHWPKHARTLAPSEDIFDLSLSFYHEKSRTRESWLTTYWTVKKYGYPPKSFTLLDLASYSGIRPLAENLLDNRKLKLSLNEVDDKRMTALMWAAQGGHEAVVLLLLEKGADVHAKNTNAKDTTALHEAAVWGHEAVVRLLLEKGSDVDAKTSFGWTALCVASRGGYEAVVQLLLEKRAAEGGHGAVVQLLLEKGADVSANTSQGMTALHMAARMRHEAVVRLLLEKRADVEAKSSNGTTVLNMAAEGGHEAILRLLLEKGADLEAKTHFEWTALHKAAEGGHGAVVRLLLEKGADLGAKISNGKMALHMAAEGGRGAVVRLLLEKGADVEAKTIDGETALYMAAQGGHGAVVQLLLEKGADVSANTIYGRTALHKAAKGGHGAVVRLLLEKGADLEAKISYGTMALHMAAEGGHWAVVRLLLEKGADVEAKTIDGETALHMAARTGHEAVVRLLLEKRADLEAKISNGTTALHMAAEGGHEAILRLLLEKRADLEAKTRIGWTALYLGARNGHKAMVRLLLEKGADVEAKTIDGETALHMAAEGGHEAMVRLLLESGADLEAKTSNGRTALNLATAKRHTAVVQLLTPYSQRHSSIF
ncbi:Ankyrin-2 [Lobaria immixta]|nr:Ankyrin-2 [Lobaria immixta]